MEYLLEFPLPHLILLRYYMYVFVFVLSFFSSSINK